MVLSRHKTKCFYLGLGVIKGSEGLKNIGVRFDKSEFYSFILSSLKNLE